MTVQEKMNIVVSEVLGEGYEVRVIDEYDFETYYVDCLLLTTETSLELRSHWKQHAKSIIMSVINRKLEDALKKV